MPFGFVPFVFNFRLLTNAARGGQTAVLVSTIIRNFGHASQTERATRDIFDQAQHNAGKQGQVQTPL
jgi:hypothetical protein